MGRSGCARCFESIISPEEPLSSDEDLLAKISFVIDDIEPDLPDGAVRLVLVDNGNTGLPRTVSCATTTQPLAPSRKIFLLSIMMMG